MKQIHLVEPGLLKPSLLAGVFVPFPLAKILEDFQLLQSCLVSELLFIPCSMEFQKARFQPLPSFRARLCRIHSEVQFGTYQAGSEHLLHGASRLCRFHF